MPTRFLTVASFVAAVSIVTLAMVLVASDRVVAGTPATPAGTPGAPPEARVDAEGAVRAQAPGARLAAGGANLSRIWWNQPRPVEVLGLTDEQRKAMDALLVDHLGRRRELAKESLEIRRGLGDHLAAGDWKAAENASAELGARASALAKSDADLTLAVVRLLSSEQRQTLDRELPMVLRRPWLQGGMGLRPGRMPRPGGPVRPPA